MKGCANNVEDADWVSIKSLAEVRGVSHQAVSKRIAGFVRKGLLQTRRAGKERLVHRPTFDALSSASHDPAQDLRLRHLKEEPPAEPLDGPDSEADRGEPLAPADSRSKSAYDDASAREKNAKAELAEMELARRRAELVPASELADAAVQVATTIAQHVAALKQIGGRLYAAAQAGGEDAVRVILSDEIDRVTSAVRDGLLKLANEKDSEPQTPRPN